MHRPKANLYQWILAGAAVGLMGWLGFSLFVGGSSQSSIADALPERSASIVVEVRGMYCASCELNVHRSLSEMEGIEHVEVRLDEEEARIWTAENTDLDDEMLRETIARAGYEPGDIRRN